MMITSSLTSKTKLICWVVSVFIIVALVHAESPTFHVTVHNGKNDSLILASEETRRQDPLDNLNYYTGGWNISNQHYIGSLAYSAAPLFLTAGIWFVGIGLFMVLSCLCFCCCCGQRSYGYSKTAYACSVILLMLFTIVAITGAVFLYSGQGKYHESTEDTLDYVVDQADIIVKNLNNVSTYLIASKKAGVNHAFLPADVQSSIDNVASMINSSATTLKTVTVDNKDDIKNVLERVRHILVVVAAAMLLLALLGFLFSVFGLQFLVYILIIVTWILVAGTFILSGVFLLLHNATGDTCIAMDEWVENPRFHTALDDILPCVEPATAKQSLAESKDVVFQLVEGLNGIITNVSNANFSFIASPIGYNQSGPPVPILCNPFNTDMSARKCITGEVDISNATQVWKDNVCQVGSGDVCITVGRLTPSIYEEMAGVVNVSYGLYHYGPFLTDLADCTFVRETFSGIYSKHCPDLKKYSGWVYIGLTMVSSAVALSMIFWLLYARERRHRKYTKLVDSASHRANVYGK